MDANFLAALTRIAINRNVYEPTVSEVKDRYYHKFRAAVRRMGRAHPLRPGSSAAHALQFE